MGCAQVFQTYKFTWGVPLIFEVGIPGGNRAPHKKNLSMP